MKIPSLLKGGTHIMTMGELIRYYRKDVLHMTQTELGEKLGINKAAIQKYEKGYVENIPRGRIKQMADLFGIKASELMCFEDEKDNITCDIIEKCYGSNAFELVELFSQLNDAGKTAALTMIKSLTTNNDFVDSVKKEYKNA
jgi:transcriptional regulator with XRE-family HTH domain